MKSCGLFVNRHVFSIQLKISMLKNFSQSWAAAFSKDNERGRVPSQPSVNSKSQKIKTQDIVRPSWFGFCFFFQILLLFFIKSGGGLL